MHVTELETPAILVRTGALEQNLKKYQEACSRNNKELWPMVKTHKSTEIARMQKTLGATGFLCGTLDECEALCDAGMEKLMYAYPAAGKVSCRRAARLAGRCEFFARIDSYEAAAMLEEAAKEEDVTVNYTLIVDCGLHRFGLSPEETVKLAGELSPFTHLKFMGISTHSGQVYAEADPSGVAACAKQERDILHRTVRLLKEAGWEVPYVTTGSTPTFRENVSDEVINVFHPGNYVFHDSIQLSNGTAVQEECALVVYAAVISHPEEALFICDAGAKCLGLDKGAHGNASVEGFGQVIGHPELVVEGLSEEVGKLHVKGETDLKVGDRIMIIPNHSCSSANLTDYYIMIDDEDMVTDWILVDIRGNRTKKVPKERIR